MSPIGIRSLILNADLLLSNTGDSPRRDESKSRMSHLTPPRCSMAHHSNDLSTVIVMVSILVVAVDILYVLLVATQNQLVQCPHERVAVPLQEGHPRQSDSPLCG